MKVLKNYGTDGYKMTIGNRQHKFVYIGGDIKSPVVFDENKNEIVCKKIIYKSDTDSFSVPVQEEYLDLLESAQKGDWLDI